MSICDLGCGRKAEFYSKYTKRRRCEKSSQRCPAVKARNSAGCKKAYADGRKDTSHLDGKRGWAKGYTKETHSGLAKMADALTGRKLIDETEKIKRDRYSRTCKWSFDSDTYSKLPGYELLIERGMYNKHTNKDGVVRDHRYSVYDGYINNVDPSIISHPANCEILTHKDNARKTRNSSITLKQLIADVSEWVDEQD